MINTKPIFLCLLSIDGSESGRQVKTVQERWRESLLACSSLSQVFLHLSTLERSVVWAKSILNARCKVCRRKGDAENMLLCDACERGYHIFCARPKLKVRTIVFGRFDLGDTILTVLCYKP